MTPDRDWLAEYDRDDGLDFWRGLRWAALAALVVAAGLALACAR